MKEGRPTKYKEEYCKKMIAFFNIPHTVEKERTKVNKDGSLITWFEEVANKLPTFERFAAEICNVDYDTLLNWKNLKDEKGDLINVEFFGAYNKCKNFQKDMINDLGMRGFYNAAYTKFVAINITDMKDTQHVQGENNNTTRTLVVTQKEIDAAEAELEKELDNE